jgi:hypothetical protein
MKRLAFASGLTLGVLIFVPALPLAAGAESERIPPVKDPVVIKECGACHIVFQPALLPGRSWRKIMEGLSRHFGENAELGEAAKKRIATYMEANAAEKDEYRDWALRGLGQADAPLRVSEMPWFTDEHASANAFTDEKMKYARAKSKADCVACHRDASEGYYDDIGMPLPAKRGNGQLGIKSMQ